jgi:RNA polymerase sigma-70 factor (ECF subfamily)
MVTQVGEANGEPVLVVIGSDGLRGVCFFEFDAGRLVGLDFVMNPDKLAFAERQLSRIGGLAGLAW